MGQSPWLQPHALDCRLLFCNHYQPLWSLSLLSRVTQKHTTVFRSLEKNSGCGLEAAPPWKYIVSVWCFLLAFGFLAETRTKGIWQLASSVPRLPWSPPPKSIHYIIFMSKQISFFKIPVTWSPHPFVGLRYRVGGGLSLTFITRRG